MTTSAKAIESIKLQRNHHIKQRDLIQYHFDKYKKIEKQKPETSSIPFNERVINSNKIQLDLFENIDSTDGLLEELKKSLPESQTAIELQQTNSQLNVLLYQLITHHDETIQENDQLKEKIKALESDLKSRISDKRHETFEVKQKVLRDSPEAGDAEAEEFAPLDLPEFDLDPLQSPKY